MSECSKCWMTNADLCSEEDQVQMENCVNTSGHAQEEGKHT